MPLYIVTIFRVHNITHVDNNTAHVYCSKHSDTTHCLCCKDCSAVLPNPKLDHYCSVEWGNVVDTKLYIVIIARMIDNADRKPQNDKYIHA